ncbi:DNA polymerase III subunit beta [Streptomyces sp. 5-6(2022)]|uniref:DNA polymerase III subunit beta n=1 Tax=Streptomyces sp. 5-6(2022) TaxID=2936510 RepID=UPI0023B8F571|nr:DNA polymerase III subunit beta [Streptomyces sp. 5-6(2022)]
MKINVDQRALADAARWASRYIADKPTVPVLSGLLLNAHDDVLTISGFDYDTSGRATVAADTASSGSIVVPGRLLADVTATLPDSMVELTADDDTLTVTAPGNQFTLPLLPAREYPALPKAPAPTGTADAAEFAAAVKDVATAAMATKDAVGQVEGLGGIRIRAQGERLELTATDRYRIPFRTLPWQPNGPADDTMLITAPILADIAKSLSSGEVSISFPGPGDGMAGFATTDRTVAVRTRVGGFPPVENLVPKTEAATGYAEFDPAELAAAARRVAIVREKNKLVRVTLRGDHAEIVARGDGPAASTSIETTVDGVDDGFEIAFDPEYLTTMLAPLGDRVRIWLYTPTRPVLIEPLDGTPYRAVLMPVRVKQ